MIRALIVANTRLYRDGLARLLDAEEDIEVVGTSAHWGEVLSLAARKRPNVVLLDFGLAEAHAALSAFRAANPAARVVAMSIGETETEIVSCAEAGVAGFLTREDSLDHLLEVVRGVASDEFPCSPQLASTLLRRVSTLASARGPAKQHARLTARELEIVELIEGGLSNKEISRELCIQVATVKNHIHHILEKLQVHRRTEAVARLRGLPGRAHAQEGAHF